MPTEIFHDTLTCPDGTRLFVRFTRATDPCALMIITHGLSEHSGRYEHVIDYFTRRGYAVAAYDHRGHGASEGDRGDVGSFSEWIDDLRFVVQTFRMRIGAAVPRIVMGHSLGGLVALSFAGIHGEADGFVISSPALGPLLAIPEWKARVGERAAKLMPRFHVSAEIDPADLSRDPAAARAFRDDPLVLRRFTLRLGREIVGAAAGAMPLAYRISCPVLLLQAREDRICSSAVTRRFFDGIACPVKKLILYDGAFHEPFNDFIRERAMGDVEHWLHSSVLGALRRTDGVPMRHVDTDDISATGKVGPC